MKWITREKVKVDRVACPWLIRKFIDSKAEFWAAFIGSDQDAAVAGDAAMLTHEITPVMKALRANGIDVVAMHQHMTTTQPTIFFRHYWGRGPAEKLAAGFKVALDELGKKAHH